MKYLYQAKSNQSKEAFLITKSSKLEVLLNQQDYYEINDRPFVIGIVEILLKIQNPSINYVRKYSVRISKDSSYHSITIDQLEKDLLEQFNSGFMICRSLAKELFQVNQFISKKQAALTKDKQLVQKYCEIFYQTISELEKYFIKNRFPWLEQIIIKNKDSLTYIRGLALISIYSKNKVSMDVSKENNAFESKRMYTKGSTICREGDNSDEVYILESGKLEVLINNNVIDTIDQKMSIIGEMALLLGEKRNATIRTEEDSILRVIKKTDFKEFCKKNKIFLREIAFNLATRIYSNCQVLEQLNYSLTDHVANIEIAYNQQENHKQDLFQLKDDIKMLSNKYDFDWLTKIYIKLAKYIMDIN